MRPGCNPGILTIYPPAAVRILSAILLASLAACAHRAPRPPGPLAPIGRDARIRTPPPPVVKRQPKRHDTTREDKRAVRSPLASDVANAASFYLKHAPSGFRNDCSGFVCAAFDRAGIDLSGSTRSMWEHARANGATHKRKRPKVGDLAFFDHTYDRNRNGRLDDDLSHIAVVIEVQDDGTVLLAHSGTSRGRATLTMNLLRPDDHSDESGKILNDWLRRKTSKDAPGTKYLAGGMWRCFASPEGLVD